MRVRGEALMAFTQADLDALDASIAKGGGVEEIQFSDRRVRFYTLDDRLKLRALMTSELNPSTAPASRFAAFSKGFRS